MFCHNVEDEIRSLACQSNAPYPLVILVSPIFIFGLRFFFMLFVLLRNSSSLFLVKIHFRFGLAPKISNRYFLVWVFVKIYNMLNSGNAKCWNKLNVRNIFTAIFKYETGYGRFCACKWSTAQLWDCY